MNCGMTCSLLSVTPSVASGATIDAGRVRVRTTGWIGVLAVRTRICTRVGDRLIVPRRGRCSDAVGRCARLGGDAPHQVDRLAEYRGTERRAARGAWPASRGRCSPECCWPIAALTRRELSAELFPEAADPLGSLRWCLASLRKTIGSAEVLTGDPIQRRAPGLGQRRCVRPDGPGCSTPANIGELLDGVDPPCGPEFSTWLLVARQQVSSRIAAQLRDATITAISRSDHPLAVELAELAARRSPYDEGAQVLARQSARGGGSPDRGPRTRERGRVAVSRRTRVRSDTCVA